jgi:thiol:disulfide interchange protein DsbD
MGYIGTRSGKKKLKGLYLSMFFVLGLAFVYSILGVIAATTGTMMGASFQNPVVVIVIAAIFVIMGLSLAGLFEIPVPTSISAKMQGGQKSEVIGSLLIGGVAGIIAAPCVGPVLIALLSWISQTKDVVFGFLLTFTFSLGMGVIFLLVGTFSGLVSAMPKGGKWMDHIKHFFAAILIGGGIFIMNPILPGWLALLLWGIYLVVLSVLMGLLAPLQKSTIKNKIYKLIVIFIFLSGTFLMMKSMNTRFFSPPPDTAITLETGWLQD